MFPSVELKRTLCSGKRGQFVLEKGNFFGERSILPYKLVYCALIVVATAGILENDADLDALTGLGTGVMLWANIPLMLIFGSIAMKAYKAYGKRLKDGEFDSKEG